MAAGLCVTRLYVDDQDGQVCWVKIFSLAFLLPQASLLLSPRWLIGSECYRSHYAIDRMMGEGLSSVRRESAKSKDSTHGLVETGQYPHRTILLFRLEWSS